MSLHVLFFKRLVQCAGLYGWNKTYSLGLTIALCMEDHGRIEADPCSDATQHVADLATYPAVMSSDCTFSLCVDNQNRGLCLALLAMPLLSFVPKWSMDVNGRIASSGQGFWFAISLAFSIHPSRSRDKNLRN